MSREEVVIYPQSGKIVAFCGAPTAQIADCKKQCNVLFKWTAIKSNTQVHLLPIDILIGTLILIRSPLNLITYGQCYRT